MKPLRPALVIASLLLSVLGACGDIEAEYQAYLNRADRSNPNVIDPDAARGKGVVADIRGQHIFNVDLKPIGAIKLRLRVSIREFVELEGGRARVEGDFRLADADPDRFEPGPDSPPLATFTSEIEEDGYLEIDLGRVYVPAALSPIPETAVDVVLRFKAIIVSADEICGFIDDPESVVIAPAPFVLVGTTFGSARWNPDGSQPPRIPETCPFPLGIPTGPPPEPTDPEDLRPPGIETPFGQPSDIGGRFFMRAAVAGSNLVLDFILDTTIETHESDPPADCRRIGRGTSQYVRAELRTFTNDDRYGPEDPPVGRFCSQISERGLFNALVRGIVAPSSLGEVNGDIALSAVIVDQDTFCATAAGTVTRPLSLNLAGSTAGFVRMAEDAWELPASPLAACPPVLAPPPPPLPQTGVREDLTGRWFFEVRSFESTTPEQVVFQYVGDLRSLRDEDNPDALVVDALLRRYGNGARPTDPGVGIAFGSVVSPEGQFVLQANGILGQSSSGQAIDGNMAMRLVALSSDVLCGEADGRLFRPFQAPFASFRVVAARLPETVWGEVQQLPSCP